MGLHQNVHVICSYSEHGKNGFVMNVITFLKEQCQMKSVQIINNMTGRQYATQYEEKGKLLSH